ncbi:hypothetical protein BM536_018445 [Streptomyces phaeoluteigriseus]|uniref:Band 7 domain-containing protein n=1 Tax=Streptomyces phaeoluteigriseus TaxID=114686 RepID=A0A1V6MNN5_9ACTN|nr:hypothetical protein [Streptomyces phaeoluteigriseus]OQD54084.1 hypothetical protein BM536_018445 [Streptomyces phaeoluteigriseus]
MEEQTYDPVLGSEDLPKWRLTNPLRPPAPGRALVLVRDSGPSLTIRNGEEIPSSRFGTYRSVFTVDMTEHRLILDIPLLSRDPTFSFRSRVDLVCKVADPAEVVGRGIRDMSGALYGHLRRTLRSVARDYDIAEFHEAERALNTALAGFGGDDAIRLRNVQIELLVDEDEIVASGREFRDVVRETRLDGMRRRRHLDMIREEGVDGLIADIMEKEGPRAALAWIEKGEAEKREVRREVMRMVLERGDADREPFEQAELERAVLEEVLRDGDGLFETATRRGRLRGSLARALEPGTAEDDERAPLTGEVVKEGRYDDTRRPPEPAPREDRPARPRPRITGGAPARPRFGGPPTTNHCRTPESPAARVPPAAPGIATTTGGAPATVGRAPVPGTGPARRTSAARYPDDGPSTGGPAPDERRRTGDDAADRGRTPEGGRSSEGGRGEDAGPRVSRVRGTAKRPRGGGSGTHDGERR